MHDGAVSHFNLSGRLALVTGASGGIGAAVTQRFCEAGATVIGADLQAPATRLNASVEHIMIDVADEASVASAARRLKDRPIDILVNNAGVAFDEGELTTSDLSLVRKTLDVNLFGVILMTKYFGPLVRDGGSIINTASAAASIGMPGYAAYASSKAGVVAVTNVSALEFGARNIRVNAVCPGTIETPMESADSDEATFARRASTLGRIGQTDDLIGLFHFLAADESRYLTGQAIYVDGGISAGFAAGLLD